MLHRGLFETEDHPVTGAHPIPTLPFRFRDRDRGWLHRPTPTLGQHNDEVLGGLLGLSADELRALREAAVIGERPRAS
jgi:crotonobetainyl-CoA:carnitine CoA-transferase CaiB-like acyl-CoA transferase